MQEVIDGTAKFQVVRKEGTPCGVVEMFSGTFTEDNHPIDTVTGVVFENYLLCDGTNGTPNLLDKMIIGSGNKYTVGDTGGEETHTLTVEEIPSHTHTAWTDAQNPSGFFDVASWSAGIGVGGCVNGWGDTGSLYASDGGNNQPNRRYYVNPNHAHNVGIGGTGGSLAHNNLPPYYALAFILKVG